MRKQLSENIEGLVLLNDVLGKTGRPIMKKNTVLTDKHVFILQKFLVDTVSVGPVPTQNSLDKRLPEKQEPTEKVKLDLEKNVPTDSFYDDYVQTVSQYKKEYEQWYNGVPIDISKVRKLIIPLLEQVETLHIQPFLLHDFVDSNKYIYNHSTSVSILSAFIASHLGYEKGECLQIGIAALLSDAGMAKVDQDIVTKVGPLTTKQMEEIQHHSLYSYQMVEKISTITTKGKQAILQHHERIDGSGYPAGLKGSKIHPYARIIAVCDTYYGITSSRLYKKKQPIVKAIEELHKEKHTKLDGQVVSEFIHAFTKQALNQSVRLSDGSEGTIVYIAEDNPANILVKLEETSEVISLRNNANLFVEAFIY